MTKVRSVLVVGVAVAALAGCSSGGDDAGKATSTTTTSSSSSSSSAPTTPAVAVTDTIYLDTVRDRFPQFDDEGLLGQRKAVCSLLDTTPTNEGWLMALKVYLDKDVEAEDAGYLLGAMVRTGCPEHVDVLP